MRLFYRHDMCPQDEPGNYSKSPTKPRRFVEFLQRSPLWPHIALHDDFAAIRREDLLLAHTPAYVDAFLDGEPPLCESNGLRWSPAFRDSVLMTNGCLLAAITAANAEPQILTMAPVSGFHHAQPARGSGFCTFSGQVIAGLKLYRERGLRGAWVDLDGHFGNSIEDSRSFCPDLDQAIPVNLNPNGQHQQYLRDLEQKMTDLLARVAEGSIDYICVAHGADSHEWDQLGHQCTTEEWLRASEIVYGLIQGVRKERAIPVTLALFGGYRDDHPESVLGLHAMDTALAMAHLEQRPALLDYQAEVRAPWQFR